MSEHNEDAQAIGELPETNEGAAGSGGDMEQTVQTEPVSGDGGTTDENSPKQSDVERTEQTEPVSGDGETNENRPKEGDPPTAPANKGSDRDRLAQIRMFKYDKKGLGDRTELIRQRLGRLQGEKEDWARKEKKWEEERKEWEKERQLYGEHILDLQKTINDASEYLTSINEDLVVKLGV